VGPDFGPLTTTEVGIWGLWGAALLTLITGYDYLRAGLLHIIETDIGPGEKPDQDSGSDGGHT
jgi:cardiolipin synthase